MARIRTVKPELARHRKLFELEKETGLPMRFAWAMFPSVCCREGRFEWDEYELCLDILPYEGVEIFSRVIDALLSRGFLVKYRVGSCWYGWIPTFTKHQFINNKEKTSDLPGIDEAEEVIDYRNQSHNDANSTRSSRDGVASGSRSNLPLPEGKGREQGKESNAPKGAKDPDLLWEALLKGCGIPLTAKPTESERGAWNKALKDLRAAGATEQEIAARCQAYRKLWPGISLTPSALARRWNECVAGNQQQQRPRKELGAGDAR